MRIERPSLSRLIWASLLGVAGIYGQDQREAPARLSATFLQLWAEHANWSPDRWRSLFRHFKTLDLREVYVQWSLYDDLDYYSSRRGRPAPIDAILRHARESGMTVHLGLAFHSGFWKNIKPGPELRAYLAAQRNRSVTVADDLSRRYGSHPAFAGWYIPEEIDEWMWPARVRAPLFDHLNELTAALHSLAPGKTVTISGYSGTRSQPAQVAAFWQSLLERVSIDTVMFQDGIGVKHLTLTELPPYLEAVRQATERTQRNFRVIAEVFRQVDGSFNGRPFRAIPAPFAAVLPQIQAAAPYSEGGVVAFSIPEYMTPLGGIEAEQTYLNYLDWRKITGAGQTQISALPSGTPAR